MKRYLLAATLAISLGVSACETIGTPPNPVVTGQQTLMDERAMTGAELVYNTAFKLYLRLDAAGQIDPAAQIVARQFLLEGAYPALLAARTAYAAGNAATFNEQVALVVKFTGQARELMPRGEE